MKQLKPSTTTGGATMNSRKPRVSPFEPKSSTIVGEYSAGKYTPKAFGADTKSFRIGEKQKEKVSSGPGPGEYEPERA